MTVDRLGPPPGARRPDLVSVIIPARDSEATLAEQLEALRGQDHPGAWELILADNGSTDATTAVFDRVAGPGSPAGSPWTGARVVDASVRPGSAHARNVGASAARGDLLCFCDADDVVDASWLAELVRVAADHHLVGGRLETEALNSARVRSWRPTPATTAEAAPDFVPSSNMAIWADCFEALGGFDEDFLKSHDVELSKRAQAAGADIGFAPGALVHYRLRATLGGLARQAYRAGRATVQMAARHPDRQPQVGGRAIARRVGWTLVRLPYLASADRRGLWVRRSAELAGIVVAEGRALVPRRRGEP